MITPIPAAVSAYMSKLGKKGGVAIDPAKASERARKGGLARAKKNGFGQFAPKAKRKK